MESRVEEPGQPDENDQVYDQGPASWVETLAGILLFLAMGLYLILEEIPVHWIAPENIPLREALIWTLVFLPAAGFAFGWIRKFPRWTYAYIGAMLFSSYMPIGYSPYLIFFGIPWFGNDHLGWRALIPLLLASGIGLVVTRSFRPLFVLVDRANQDTTLITYALFGTMPIWVMISFDEIDRLYSLPWMVVLVLLMVATSLAYLRSRSLYQCVASLSAGVLLGFTLMILGPMLFMPGWVDVVPTIFTAVFLAALMLAPAFFDLARASAGLRRVR